MRALKQENELVRRRCDSQLRELAIAQDHASQQSTKIQVLEREKIQLVSRAERDTLCSRVESTDGVVQLMKDKGDLELHCRQLTANLAGTHRSALCRSADDARAVRCTGACKSGAGGYAPPYDTRCYFNVRSKADISQLNPPHGTDN